MGCYTCKPKFRKWTITVFSNVIDMIRVNSATTFALQKKYDPCKQDSFEYCYTFIVSVSKTIYTITKLEWLYYSCETKIELVVGKKQWEVEGEAVGPPMSEDKGRCHVCISNMAGVGHKLTKNQTYRVKTLCRICKKHTCKDLLIETCEIC